MPQGWLDNPSDNEIISGTYQIFGWYLDSEQVIEIQILLNNILLGIAYYGDLRPAFKELFPEYGYINAGFNYSLNTCSLDNGEYRLTITAVNSSGAVFCIGERTIIIHNQFNTPKKFESKHILVACFPKSGSTYLTNTLINLTGYSHYPLVYQYGQNEQDLYYPALINVRYQNSITQQHLRGTKINIELLNRFRINPIILVRNIFDVIISYYDHLCSESIEVPTCYLNNNFFQLDNEKQLDLIIDLVVPWYFSFYTSWYDATRSKVISTLWITYEQFMGNKVKGLNDILNFYGLTHNNLDVENAINQTNKSKNRLNKGIIGRGESSLTIKQKEKIKNYKIYFPLVDFSKMGL